MSVAATADADAAGAAARALQPRVRLANVRAQRIVGETVTDPPFAIASVSVSASAPEVAVDGPMFACRITYRVVLLDDDHWDLGAVEIALVMEFEVSGEPPERDVVGAFVNEHGYEIALPYVREAVHSVASRLGLAVVLGLLNENDVLPTEVTFIGAPQQPTP